MTTRRLFLSYAHEDAAAVGQVRAELADRGYDTWQDIQQLRAGADLSTIKSIIEESRAFVVFVSRASLASEWVNREISVARSMSARRPDHLLIPVLLDGADPVYVRTMLGEPDLLHISVSHGPCRVAALIREALNDAPPRHPPPPPPPPDSGVAELVIEIAEPALAGPDEDRQVNGRVRIRLRIDGAPEAKGSWQPFRAGIATGDLAELRWYLETFPTWPHGQPVTRRAAQAEARMLPIGQQLYRATLGLEPTFVTTWANESGKARRVTLEVDADPSPEVAALLGMPWELLAHGDQFICDPNRGGSIRRRLPPRESLLPLSQAPRRTRVLVVLSRPEQDQAPLLDPRACVQHVVSNLGVLDGGAQLEFLAEPTYRALEKRLDQQDYDVVHFDGHGAYDARTGLAELHFEDEGDVRAGRLRRSAHVVPARTLGELIQRRRTRLFVLAAVQTPDSRVEAATSVAVEMMRVGVASVIVMSHAVPLSAITAWASGFYGELARGSRVGSAMMQAQAMMRRRPRTSATRASVDWFVPVLYQHEDGDDALFADGPAVDDADIKHRRATRLGALPAPPMHDWVGRTRLLLDIQRTFERYRVVLLRGVGGVGKTAIAIELARWLHDCARVDRIAFVSMEGVAAPADLIQSLGRQLVADFDLRALEGAWEDSALHAIDCALAWRRTLLVIDNFESITGHLASEPDACAQAAAALTRFANIGQTRVLVTSREQLPTSLQGAEVEVATLEQAEGKALAASVLATRALRPRQEWDDRSMDSLVKQLRGHARAIVLLAPLLAELGVQALSEQLDALLTTIDVESPGNRERSLLASVKLSMSRLVPDWAEATRALVATTGTVHIRSLAHALGQGIAHAEKLFGQLESAGLAQIDGDYAFLDPALPTAIGLSMSDAERRRHRQRWTEATMDLAAYLRGRPEREKATTLHALRTGIADFAASVEDIQANAASLPAARLDSVLTYLTTLEDMASAARLVHPARQARELRHRLAAPPSGRDPAGFHSRLRTMRALSASGDRRQAIDEGHALLRDLTNAGALDPNLATSKGDVASFLAGLLIDDGRESDALEILSAMDL